jgi:hypothetical protein
LLSSIVLLPLYLAYVRRHEPTLLGISEPRSDGDSLEPSFETETSRVEAMLRARAAAGERLQQRIQQQVLALSTCPYVRVAASRRQ